MLAFAANRATDGDTFAEALREERLSNSAFAVAMGVQESEVRRMLDSRHATKIGRLEEALARFGKRLVVIVEAAA